MRGHTNLCPPYGSLLSSSGVGWARLFVPTRKQTRVREIKSIYHTRMSHYRRSLVAGGTYLFTIALADRQSNLLVNEIDRLRGAYKKAASKWPFETVAICILPEHLHAIWTLPPGDTGYAMRWQHIKRWFSLELPAAPERSQSKMNKREKGLWQRRYWEHLIRDEDDLR